MKTITFILIMTIPLSGCVTTEGNSKAARTRADIDNLKSDVYTINERLNMISQKQEIIDQEIAKLRSAMNQDSDLLQKTIKQLDVMQKNSDARIKKLQEDIINDLSGKISTIIKTQVSPQSSYGERGREHVVQPGETLSAISQAYGVNINIIIKANNLKNPDSLSVGKKLFIPE
jgi:LysM repeat protein